MGNTSYLDNEIEFFLLNKRLETFFHRNVKYYYFRVSSMSLYKILPCIHESRACYCVSCAGNEPDLH